MALAIHSLPPVPERAPSHPSTAANTKDSSYYSHPCGVTIPNTVQGYQVGSLCFIYRVCPAVNEQPNNFSNPPCIHLSIYLGVNDVDVGEHGVEVKGVDG